MIATSYFENLIERPESTILDFKKEMYDFSKDLDYRKTAEFIKDIISFANTIRTESAFIIIGIKDLPDKSKELHGLTSNIDDAILQDKVKDKVYPRPAFQYYTITFNNLRFGVIELPVAKYSVPISPSVRIKGLEPGKVYYRQGTTNTEASGMEVIKINDWLRSLPELTSGSGKNDQINGLLKDLTANQKNLSGIIGEMYTVAKTHQIHDLLNFCIIELQGVDHDNRSGDEELDYRIQNLFLSPIGISINPYYSGSAYFIKEELKNNPDIRELKMLFSYSINKIEDLQRGFKDSDKTVAIIKSNWNQFYPDDRKDIAVSIYIFPDTVVTLLANIRQKAIDLLMKL